MGPTTDAGFVAAVPALLWITEWLIRVAMIPIVLRKRPPESATAWLLIVFFEPRVGVILYMLLGDVRLGRSRTRRARQARDMMRQLVGLPRAPDLHRHESIPAHHRDLALLASRLGEFVPAPGNRVDLLASADELAERLEEDLDRAQDHAHLLYYIFRDDGTGGRVLRALERAAARGVHCRVLADGAGSKELLRDRAPSLRRAGVDVRAALPVSLLRALFQRIDLRNHRKIAVIDHKIAYTGSHNLVHPDYGQRRFGPWVDLTLRVEGPAAGQLHAVFAEDWYLETNTLPTGLDLSREPEVSGPATVQVIPSGPGYGSELLEMVLLAAAHEAQSRLCMTTPYFVPSAAILTALRVASLRGVEVDLVLPRRVNSRLVALASEGLFDSLLESGVRIHRHRDGLLHSKTLTVDSSFALVGSANLDMRSFRINFEVTTLLFDPGVVREVEARQHEYIVRSDPMPTPGWEDRGSMRRLAERAARLTSPLL